MVNAPAGLLPKRRRLYADVLPPTSDEELSCIAAGGANV